jgi:hypothetical protein
MKRIIIFLGLFVLVGAISIGGHWPSAHGAVVLPRPDLVSQSTSTPNPVSSAAEHSKAVPQNTPAPSATPASSPTITPSPTASPEPTPWPSVTPTPTPVDTPQPSPHPTCPPCGGSVQGASQIMCPMIMCRE